MFERAAPAALAAVLALAAPPVHAQSRDADPELEALIPDEALADPQAWAKGDEPSTDPIIPLLDPASPLAEMPEIDLPWPDEGFEVPQLAPLEPDPDVQLADAGEEAPRALADSAITTLDPQYSLAYPTGEASLPERAEFEDRFRGLSTLLRLSKVATENAAQIVVRARSDRALLQQLLRVYGYYDGEVRQTIGGIAPGQESATISQVNVRFEIFPGARFRFGVVQLPGLAASGDDETMLRGLFAIQTGDPLYADAIIEERGALDEALGESGYAFAKLGEPDLLIDHAREEGDLTLPVTPGGRYAFGDIVSNLPGFLPAWHLENIARFGKGDPYRRSAVVDLQRAVLATGLVSSAVVTPRATTAHSGTEAGVVAIDVEMTKAPLRTIAGAIGYDSGDGFRLEASWEHRNMFPPEGMLRLRGVAGTKEQLLGATLRKHNFRGRDQVLTLDLYANYANREAYEARTVALTASFEKLTTLIFQKPWTWSVGIEALATAEREGDVNGIESPLQTYFVGALPLRAAYDATDDLLDPQYGFRTGLRISPEVSIRSGQKSTYVRVQADASYYLPVADKVVVAARVRLGSIPGTALGNIAPSRRFYAGGGGSVRGYGYQLIGPRDSLGEPSGGRSLSEFSLEARVKTGLMGGAVSLVPFIDAGAVDETVLPRLRDIRYGAGLGVRYQTGFGPIRVDVGMPLNRRPGDSRIAVYVALGQAF